MKDNGFNVDIWTDPETGFTHGGNKDNCGTWMDKMGSADSVKGVPATPRDGAPIELVGLQYSVISFFAELKDKGMFEECKDDVPLRLWSEKIKAHFEERFYIPTHQQDDNQFIDKKLVNRRGIYKDTYLSSSHFTDYQLRPNLCIAMAVAPELFQKEHALTCLHQVE
jgi:glycogen debranching enzyme